MSYIGTVENGQIKLPPDAQLPEGAKVEVAVLSEGPLERFTREVLKVAKSSDRPKDFATNFGHYLFGEEKR
jgi:hypothetical protein